MQLERVTTPVGDLQKAAWIHIVDRKMLFVRTKGKELFYNAGGTIEPGESPKDALVREIEEELGVELIRESVAFVEQFGAPVDGQPGRRMKSYCFFARHCGLLQPRGEIAEIAYFTQADGKRTTEMGRLILWHFAANLNRID